MICNAAAAAAAAAADADADADFFSSQFGELLEEVPKAINLCLILDRPWTLLLTGLLKCTKAKESI
jgi:hypothetical protein